MSLEHSEEVSEIDFLNLTSENNVEQNSQLLDTELDIELLISFIENKPVLWDKTEKKLYLPLSNPVSDKNHNTQRNNKLYTQAAFQKNVELQPSTSKINLSAAEIQNNEELKKKTKKNPGMLKTHLWSILKKSPKKRRMNASLVEMIKVIQKIKCGTIYSTDQFQQPQYKQFPNYYRLYHGIPHGTTSPTMSHRCRISVQSRHCHLKFNMSQI
ncbi:hypothetical protein QTP88_017554 [Uroleucon formosanum]